MARSRHSSSPLLTLAALVVAIAALHLAKEILLPLALAILISFLLTPLANRLERWGFGRIISVVAVVGVTFVVLGVLAYVVSSQLVDLGLQLPTYRSNLVQKVKDLKPDSTLVKDVTDTIEDVQKSMAQEKPAPEKLWDWTHGFRLPTERNADAQREPVDVRLIGTPPSPLAQIREWFGPLMGPLATAGIAVVLVIFILLKREDQRNRLLQLFGSTHLHATTEALTDVTERVSRYLRMQFLVNAGYGVAVAAGMWFIGVPNAILWGVLSFSLRFLPYVGPWLSAIMPLFVALGRFEGWTEPLMVMVWFTILELIVNNVAEPLLYGRSTGVSGVGVIVAAIFWTWLWGPIGLVLAMPLTVCAVVMAKYIPSLHFLAVLLGDQPAMIDEQRVYQRLLAGDLDEAKDLLQNRLKDATLGEVYDRVLIPALNFAERDRHAGLLHEEQEVEIAETARELVEELGAMAREVRRESTESPGGVEPPRARVLCIPLRDEADDISALMLKQLLEAEGVDVELGAPAALTGELVDSVTALKADMALISILPPLPPRSSRLLCRRLRDRYPELPILVGHWSEDALEHLEGRLCGTDGEVVTTLAAAVERVRAIAARPRTDDQVKASRQAEKSDPAAVPSA